MTTARIAAAVTVVLLAVAGCSTDGDTAATSDPATQIAGAPTTGPYEVGDTVPAGEEMPSEARREVAERLADEGDRDFVWVTDAYTMAEGGVVAESYYAVDGTGALHKYLAEEWATFDNPDEALTYAEETVANDGDAERYDVVPFDP